MEKNNIPCKIIEDLLPSYMDEILSEDVNEAVQIHLESCESCRKRLSELKLENVEEKAQIEKNEAAFVKGIKRYKHYVIGMAIGAGIPIMAFLLFILWVFVISMSS
ncbi:Putative zinc-finger [Pseudobutyrivibrio sp. 49]|uniref:zf-HC2 domain-containing protein n=1 Tax=unclassified Pseudobutyrivibrio TaxID=2638619 RepID=UPI000881D21A|nr:MULTISPECIES: zf-HC2 domain-containing protein [unclassified Pseudobutyrivibrio]SDH72973.1 Putative zinc-finger [Pseudobutyrivibrio sp. 49]SFN75355.1 Putative zinc-finger [Pseudobutyrivibrio sp. UC1225]